MCEFCDNISPKEDIEKNNFDTIKDIDTEMSLYITKHIRLDKVFYSKPRHKEICIFKGIEKVMQVYYCPVCGRKFNTD